MTPDLFPSWARRFPFLPRDSVYSPPFPPASVFKGLEGRGELSRWQQREQGGDERAGPGFLAAREIWRFPTCWKIYVPTCFLPPFLTGKGAEGPTSPRKDTSDPFDGRSCGVGPLSLLLEVTLASWRPDPPRLPCWSSGREEETGVACASLSLGPLVWEGCAGGAVQGPEGGGRRAQDSCDLGCASAGGT